MRARIQTITKKRRGLADIVEKDIDAPALRVGRRPDSHIFLADARVLLDHATVEIDAEGPIVRSSGGGRVLFDGRSEAVARVRPGSKARIGDYELSFASPPPGLDLMIGVEAAPLTETNEGTAKKPDNYTVAAHLPSRRSIGWLAGLAITLFCLVLPVLAALTPLGQQWQKAPHILDVWNPGPISNVHRTLTQSCTSCHSKPFAGIENAQCQACHQSVSEHAPTSNIRISETKCVSCHTEHTGPKMLTRNDKAFCLGCHSEPARMGGASVTPAVLGFPTGHPPFQWGASNELRDRTDSAASVKRIGAPAVDVLFSHEKHLHPQGLRTASGTEKLTCASCHVAEARGATMKPVRMEENCGRCHTLAFEPSHPEWRLPHGDPAVIKSTIAGLYSLMALSSRPDADLADKDARRPGVTSRSEALQRQADKEWVEARTREAAGTVWGPSGCGQCHATTLIAGEYALQAKSNHRPIFENAKFDHARHRSSDCGTCHVEKSASDSKIVLPGIQVCAQCHGSSSPDPGKVATTCITCHSFHAQSDGHQTKEVRK